jgi:membrane-bound lytic murein transglycosylase D
LSQRFSPSRGVRRPGGPTAPLLALLLAATGVGCGGSGPSPVIHTDDRASVPVDSLAHLPAFEMSTPDSVPVDESLLAKILRSHPDLAELESLWVDGGRSYTDGQLDLAEEYFFVLRERVDMARDDQPDSLALLYLGSLERKLDHFVEILTEDRFFSESYAPFHQSLADTYDSLRTAYHIPGFLLPRIESSTFERELLQVENEKVQSWMTYFTGRGREQYQRWLDRRARFGWIMEEILTEEELPRELIALAMIESGLQPGVRSRASAVGWWQFMAGTARLRGLQVNEWLDERRDIEMATRAASRHLKLMYGMFGNWPLALAAYNAGEYRIQRAIGLQGDPDYWELKLPRETRDYVPKFIAAARIAKQPQQYGFTSTPQDTLRFDVIELDDTFSLDQIARAGAFAARELQDLNPQLVAGCTPPNLDRYRLRVPAGRGETTVAAVASIPQDQRITWRKHTLARGETLGVLARRYRTSVQAIMDLNGITDARRVRAGRVLTIPYPRGAGSQPAPAVAATKPAPASRSTGATTYRVRSGDTLTSIAQRHGVTITALQTANRLRGSRIHSGQELRIPSSASRRVAPRAYAVDPDTHDRTDYVVRAGDTLMAIGRRFGVEVAALLAWNEMDANAIIRPGDRISIWQPRGR